jgi:hypothetical protein
MDAVAKIYSALPFSDFGDVNNFTTNFALRDRDLTKNPIFWRYRVSK